MNEIYRDAVPCEVQLQQHLQLLQHQEMLFKQQEMMLQWQKLDNMSNSNMWLSMYRGPIPCLPGEVNVQLQCPELWKRFHAETTEMIITKTGRRMFPSIQITISGLERDARYCVLLEVMPASRLRYKYGGSGGGGGGGGVNETESNSKTLKEWTSAGPAESESPVDRRTYVHPDSPANGAFWMQRFVNFNKLKITNNPADIHTNVVLTSMHKYCACVWIIRCDNAIKSENHYYNAATPFMLKMTEFIAVTAYQNDNITKLKINNNPFAKGFRETGQSRGKRKLEQAYETDRWEDEDGNASSSESESNRVVNLTESPSHRPEKDLKNHARNLDCKNVNSCDDNDDVSLLPAALRYSSMIEIEENIQRFYRPWVDPQPLLPQSTLSAMPTLRLPPTMSEFVAPPYYFNSLQYPLFAALDHRKLHSCQSIPYFTKF